MSGMVSTVHHYCTFFDHRYASKGLALFRSLVRHCTPFKLHVLCLDEGAKKILCSLNRGEIEIIDIDTLCVWDAGLAAARENRSLVEFYFTCKPSLCLYILDRNESIESLTYLDSDIYYFSSPQQVYAELADFSVGLTPHRFPSKLSVLDKVKSNGVFNAGWLFFRNDLAGRQCLQWWRSRCIDWCYDRIDGSRYADQGYLAEMPSHCARVKVVENKGVNLGPWNVVGCQVEQGADGVCVDGTLLVCYHFHGIKNLTGTFWELGTSPFHYRLCGRIKHLIYRHYLTELFKANQYCAKLSVSGATEQIRSYATRADSLFIGMPNVFKWTKLLFEVTRGVVLNSLVRYGRGSP